MEVKPISSTLHTNIPTSPLFSMKGSADLTRGDVSDEQYMVARLAVRDPEALAMVYDRYAPSLYRLMLALLSSPADAEDGLQELFLKLASGRAGRIRDLRSYLLTMARNQALSMLRQRKRERRAPENEMLDELPDRSAFNAETRCEADYWQQLLVRLSVEQREVVALKIWEGLTFHEIARIVQVSPNTVTSRYRYAIEHLRSWCREDDINGL